MHADDLEKNWISNAYEGMSRRQFLARLSAAGAGLAGFAVASQAVAGEIVTTSAEGLSTSSEPVAAGDFLIPAYAAWPAGDARHPAVLVIPEIFGMHEHIQDVTRRFAREGYFALTFEPYAREGGVAHLPDQPSVLRVANSVPDARVLADLDALAAHAEDHHHARSGGIGVTGFCRGGLYTVLFGAHSERVKAAVAWYGQIKPAMTPGIRSEGPLDVVSRIHAPLLGLYGDADQGIPSADVRELEAALAAAGKTAEFVLYPEAPHAFHADYRPSHRPEPARDAWARCLAWFGRYLKG